MFKYAVFDIKPTHNHWIFISDVQLHSEKLAGGSGQTSDWGVLPLPSPLEPPWLPLVMHAAPACRYYDTWAHVYGRHSFSFIPIYTYAYDAGYCFMTISRPNLVGLTPHPRTNFPNVVVDALVRT